MGDNEDPKRPMPGNHPVESHPWNTELRDQWFKQKTGCNYPPGGPEAPEEY